MSSKEKDTQSPAPAPGNPVREALLTWILDLYGWTRQGAMFTIAQEKVDVFLRGYPTIARAEHARTLLLDIQASAKVYQGSIGEYFAAIGEGK